jgi:hypothetical protein
MKFHEFFVASFSIKLHQVSVLFLKLNFTEVFIALKKIKLHEVSVLLLLLNSMFTCNCPKTPVFSLNVHLCPKTQEIFEFLNYFSGAGIFFWHCMGLSVNFINILCAALMPADPKSIKKIDNLTVFFTLLGFVLAKAVER